MNDWNNYLILLNCGYTIYLAAFLAKKIVWLRILTITGNILVVPYYLFFLLNLDVVKDAQKSRELKKFEC